MYYYDYEYERNYDSVNEFLTPREVMELLAIGRSTFYRLVNSGELPAIRVGKMWRVKYSELKTWGLENTPYEKNS